MSKPTIIAFGYVGRSGKGECADFLAKAYGSCGVLKTSFAKRLRFEIHQEMRQIQAQQFCPPREALRLMCYQRGVTFDPFAPVDELNPFGKQRKLQQWWGTEFRRSQCPTYWLDYISAEIEETKPSLVLIDDLRFMNEADWVSSMDGYNVHVHRPDNKGLSGEAASHVSEHALAGYSFDRKIINDSSLAVLHKRAASVALELLQRKIF